MYDLFNIEPANEKLKRNFRNKVAEDKDKIIIHAQYDWNILLNF